MKFKIDTKEKILVISPEISDLNANMAAPFITEISELPELEGRNLILDMAMVEKADDEGIQAILTVYHQQYDSALSCAVTGLNSALTLELKKADESVYNVAPTMAEAIDLVMMEDLERELLQDEE
jgi:anti-anti-sigma regulatory factor